MEDRQSMASPDQWSARAWQAYQAGQREQAEQLCWEALRQRPLDADLLYLLGVLALDRGQPAPAILHFHHLTLLRPDNPAFQNALGEAYRVGGHLTEAAACFREAIRLEPGHVQAHHALGLVLLDQGDVVAAVACFRQALAIRPEHERAHLNLGRALQLQGDVEAAAACYREAIRLKPDYAIAHNNLAVVLQGQGRYPDAVARFREALRADPNYPEAHYNLGLSHEALGDPVAAEASYRTAVRLRPEYAQAHYQLGLALEAQRREGEAIAYYQAVLRLRPNDARAYKSLGNVLGLLRQWEHALAALEHAAALAPDDAETFAHLAYARQMVCDWRRYDADVARLWADAERRLAANEPTAVIPFQALTQPWSPAQLLAVARSHSKKVSGPFFKKGPDTFLGRLRVGYLSGDFYDHPIAHLLHGLFAEHDRTRFEVFAYSFGPDDRSPYRRRIVEGCEQFREVGSLARADLAQMIAADDIHLLVDLMGYTGVPRLAALALRPAPIQVSFLGMLGTTGADFLDYLITDPIVTPPALAEFFTERFVTLPHCYLIHSPEFLAPARPRRRSDYGLPETGCAFCCFNNSYKLEPRLFDAWMRILTQAPGSVLWLYATSTACENNLRREAAARGVAPERLVFAPLVSREEHLARQQAADLFLDTRLYNGAATASLALWAGLPVLTCPGETFASRVGASLLTAVGLPELIASNLDVYEQLAVRLARQPDDLRRLRQKLAVARDTCPLFDVPRFVRNLERAYQAMWENHTAGRPPRPIVVNEF